MEYIRFSTLSDEGLVEEFIRKVPSEVIHNAQPMLECLRHTEEMVIGDVEPSEAHLAARRWVKENILNCYPNVERTKEMQFCYQLWFL